MSKELILNGFGLSYLNPRTLPPFKFGDADESAPVGFSTFGSPIFANLIFNGGSYKDENGEQIDFDELVLDVVLFDVAQTKQIIKTEITGKRGSIKEYISNGDYSVNIKGVITSENPNAFPYQKIRDLKKILDVPRHLEISSKLLNDIHNINYVVVENYSFPMKEGIQDAQFFEINCLSDDPIELTINE
jgi:hypothetical protein